MNWVYTLPVTSDNFKNPESHEINKRIDKMARPRQYVHKSVWLRPDQINEIKERGCCTSTFVRRAVYFYLVHLNEEDKKEFFVIT